MFLKKIKTFFIKKIIENAVERRKSFENQSNNICVVFLTPVEFMKNEGFFEKELVENSKKEIQFLFYYYVDKAIEKRNSEQNQNFFSWQEVKWNGEMKSDFWTKFEHTKADILVQFDDSNEILLDYLSTKIKSNFRVGYGKKIKKHQDLTILENTNETEQIWKETIKYLKILKKI